MSRRKPTSTVEANGSKPVSPDMKAPNEKTSNPHGDQSVNNYMGSIVGQSVINYMGSFGDQAVNNYMCSIGDQSVNTYMGSIGDQAVNDRKGSVGSQADNSYYYNGSNFMETCRDQADNQYSNMSNNTGTKLYKRCDLGQKHQQHGQWTTNFLDAQHTAAVPQIHTPNIFSIPGYQCKTIIPLLYLPNRFSFPGFII